LAAVFNIPSPKDDIDGSMVHKVYWEDNDLERIRIYCEKDVITTAQILLKFKSLAALSTDQITIVER
ncbi:MAG: 3'-5' exonuclease, partial [Sphingobacteriales bacterium 39-40-5]